MLKRLFFLSFILFFIIALPVKAEILDSDNDGLSDEDENFIYHTNPQLADTDGDSYLDGEEVQNGYSPLVVEKKLIEVDTDKDGLNDFFELVIGTNLGNPDTDSDGYLDGREVNNGFNPLIADPVRVDKKIEINLDEQKLAYYFGDKKLDEFLISSGLKITETPKGNFAILKKKPVVDYKGPGYNLPNTKWNLLFTYKNGMGLFIHGAYWHNNFGHPMSHGCVNVAYKNMEPLYDWVQVGTRVVIK